MDLDLVILAGQGHRAVWKMPYGEYISSSNVENPTVKVVENHIPASVETPVGSGDESSAASINNLESMVRRVVREEVGGIRVMIADMRNEDPGVAEVLAGFGYLFGLAGLVAWFRSRNHRS
jgi:nickel transport protein